MATPYVEDSDYGEVKLLQMSVYKNDKSNEFTLIGQSVAGTRTSIIIPELGTCFDFGICSLIGTQQALVLITHGHADHAGALHFHGFERTMHKMDPPTYVMPGVCCPLFQQGYDAYYKLGGARAEYEGRFKMVGVNLDQMGQDIVTTPKGRYTVRPYRMKHSVPSVGYLIAETRKKLKDEYKELEPKEIGKLVKSGADVTYLVDIPWIAFTGDTTFQGLLDNPVLFQAKILIMECTYMDFDPEETQKFAKKRSHTHIKDIEDHHEKFQNEVIVLCHFSRRYKRDQIIERVDQLNNLFGDRLEVKAFI